MFLILLQQPVDATQPSTSSGVVSSRRSRYTATVETRQRQSRSSSSSSFEDSVVKGQSHTTEKRARYAKTDSDSSATKETPKRKVTRNKSKVVPSAMTSNKQRRDSRVKSKRQKVSNEPEIVKSRGKREPNHVQNGVVEKEMATPTKNSKHVAPTSDSGITSGVSTSEKSRLSTIEKVPFRSRAESSDRERSIKTHEWFKKKVDGVRRSYRKRTMVQTPSSSDSSDD